MRPFTSTISLDEARRRLDAAVRPIARTERVRARGRGRTRRGGRRRRRRSTCRRSRARRWTATPSSPPTPPAPREQRPARLRLRRSHLHRAAVARRPSRAATCAEIATGAPLPAGADAVVMVEETAQAGDDDRRSSPPAAAGQHIGRRGADIAAGDRVVARRRRADAEPDRRARRHRPRRRRGVREAARRDSLDRQRGHRAGAAARARPDLRRQPLHARRDRRRRTAACPSRITPAQDTLDALVDALDACAAADLIVFSGGSSVGERDLIVDAIAARGEMIFHGIAVKPGKPTAFALRRTARRSSACRAIRRRACRTPTSCSCRSCARSPACRRTRRAPSACRSAAASSRRPDRHQFYTVRLRDGVALPGVQGLRRHHQPVAGRRLHRDPGGPERRGRGNARDVTLF